MGSAAISCACSTLLLAQHQIPSDSSLPSLRAHADDFDSDPEGRRKLPSFYGYLPDEGNKRTVMYVCMVVNSALLLLLRSIGAALLMLADTKIFVAYMAGDHLLYLLQKLIRGDFLHWIPIEGVAGLAMSLLTRVVSKTITDFTGLLQFRGAGELGGVMWLWSMCLALVAPWVAVSVYFGNAADIETGLDSTDSATVAEDTRELKQSDAFRLLAVLTGLWLAAFTIFLSLMKKEYRRSFWCMETGNEWVQSYFLQGERDDVKQNVLYLNAAKWAAIRPQVKEWVRSSWVGWERDKPDWYTDNWKAKVPADWVPREGREEWKEARRRSMVGSERKGSVAGIAAGLLGVDAKVHLTDTETRTGTESRPHIEVR
jgi:hypothetical protein